MQLLIMISRLKTALIHLGASICMALAALAAVYFVWYPSPLQIATGVSGIFLILLGVDIVIGPLLTLLVYKPGKKNLRFDLAVIVTLQLMAFGYGMWSISVARPAWLVFNADRFDLARAHELDTRFATDARPEFRHPPWSGPQWVASRAPANREKRNQLLLESAMGGPDLPQRIDLYVPISEMAEKMRAKAHPLEELNHYNAPAVVSSTLAKWPQADAWLPLMTKGQSMSVLLSKKEDKALAVVDLRPWN
ncbi:TfpX/TfpZ family type IV pilin accessory protein [Collimonas sp. OK412]|uniref:TfpX/TfpZ family type IV pilin accessory protein n=1 Tax=Collimonas sp. (strain OK412) TaxID=1801619 RepID=UPI001C31A885|nr:TfpX/TfpZ family type IV pilin accessory protein [Collimonas sp. OK412]